MSVIKFWIGVVLFVGNFIIGKIATFLFILYYDNQWWRIFSISLYLVSWLMLFAGIFLVGKEGWNYMVQRYKNYKKRTVKNIKKHSAKTYHKVRRHSKQAYSKLKEGVKKQMPKPKKA